jgi:hypothetical protein
MRLARSRITLNDLAARYSRAGSKAAPPAITPIGIWRRRIELVFEVEPTLTHFGRDCMANLLTTRWASAEYV